MFKFAVALALALLPGQAAAQEALEPGRDMPGLLTSGQERRFNVPLNIGQYLHLVLKTTSAAVAIQFIPPERTDQTPVIVPDAYENRQDLYWIAATAGAHAVVVKSTQDGPFILRVEESRHATPKDRDRVEAERQFLRAGADPSVESYQKAANLFHSCEQPGREGQALHEIALIYYGVKNTEQASSYLRQAASRFHDANNPQDEGGALMELAVLARRLDPDAAVKGFETALALFHKAGFTYGEAKVLLNLGSVFESLSEPAKAIASYEQALPILRSFDDPAGEANTLNNLGTANDALSHYEEAIGYFERASAIYRRLKNRTGEAGALNNLAMACHALHQEQRAADLLNQALAIERDLGLREDEAGTLNNLGVVLRSQGQDAAALKIFESLLPILRELDQPAKAGHVLANLGSTYVSMGRFAEAHKAFDRSLGLLRLIKDRAGEAAALHDRASLYEAEHQPDKAAPLYAEALGIHRQTGNRQREAETLSNLMSLWQSAGQPRLAAFYGKQSVNAYQAVRGNITGLAAETQQSFVKGVENTYRALADLLLAQSRLPEAQQVLHFLKQEEYFAFARRDGNAGPLGTVELSPEEQEWENRYRKIAGELTGIGAERRELTAKSSLTPDDEKRLERIDQDLMSGNEHFRHFLDDLSAQFRANPRSAARLEQVRDAEALKTDLDDLRKISSQAGAVLYTLAGEDKYRAILFTAEAQKSYERAIPAADLNQKVLRFREALQNPALDPRPLARELYDILIGPEMARDLESAKTDVLMWSPDGILRYLPLAALHDGRQYLVEKYALELFTPASMGRLKDLPLKEWTAAGFGLTRAYENFAALPGVSRELSSIIRTRGDAGGVLQGTVLLDDQFGKDAMLRAFRQASVIHIASHFSFRPGNETNSFLLMGDGGHLTLSELGRFPAMNGVELFTLSACNTGLGDNAADGREVEGFGVLVQRKGAKAVIASLWEVSDESTTALMQGFYEYRTQRHVSKAEALRLAQVAMLKGEMKPAPGATVESRGVRAKRDSNGAGPAFVPPDGAPHAHPYYWAPFFLMGNWL